MLSIDKFVYLTCRIGFFQNSNPRKIMQDLMKCVNECNQCGGMLTCSFSDSDLNDFVLYKKRNSTNLPRKTAVVHLGQQLDDQLAPVPNSPWILGPDIIISNEGDLLDPQRSPYICLPSTLKDLKRIPVCLPLGTNNLRVLLLSAKKILAHNFESCLLSVGAGISALHFRQLVDKRGFCHIPLLYGPPQTGKTTSLEIALSAFGCNKATFFSRGTKEAYVKKCSISTFPVGCDDPHSELATGQLMVDGAKVTLIKGDVTPLTTMMVSANFSLSDIAK